MVQGPPDPKRPNLVEEFHQRKREAAANKARGQAQMRPRPSLVLHRSPRPSLHHSPSHPSYVQQAKNKAEEVSYMRFILVILYSIL